MTLNVKDLSGGTSIQAGVTENVLLGSGNERIKYDFTKYNAVLDITLITARPQMVILNFFCYMSMNFTLVIT